jgi:hypothetical protein
MQRLGSIVVARYEGLTAATTFWGYTRWAWNGAGEMQGGIVMLDRGFDESDSQYKRSLRTHELGHALGYQHVFALTSVMNSNARTEPNAFDRMGRSSRSSGRRSTCPTSIDPSLRICGHDRDLLAQGNALACSARLSIRPRVEGRRSSKTKQDRRLLSHA